jgi:hypothetical protein
MGIQPQQVPNWGHNNDSQNGEYTEEEKSARLEEDKKKIVLAKIYHLDDGKETFVFPDPEVHDLEYAELYLRFVAEVETAVINPTKLTQYLLVKQPKNDKSVFLKGLGYDLSNPEALSKAISEKTFFNQVLGCRFNSFGLFFVAPTMLPDLVGFKLVRVRTVWQYNEDGTARFITMLVGGEKQ